MRGTKVPDASMRVKTEELLQDCIKEEPWKKPGKEPESGSGSALGFDSSSSDCSSDDADAETFTAPKPPADLGLSTDRVVLSRDPSKNSKNSVAEVDKMVEGLTSFRAALVTNQRLTLQMLDREMEKVKQLPSLVQAEAEAKSERRLKSKEVRVRLPGKLGPDAEDDFGGKGQLSKEAKSSLTPTPFAHLQTLDQKRKRRMSWIPKTGALPGTGTGSASTHDFEAQMAQLPNVPQTENPPSLPVKRSSNSRRSSKTEEEGSVESLVVAHLTKAEKAQAKREAEAFQEAGMFLGCMIKQRCMSKKCFQYLATRTHIMAEVGSVQCGSRKESSPEAGCRRVRDGEAE